MIWRQGHCILFLKTWMLAPSDGTSPAIPAVLRAALRSEPHPSQEHRHVCYPLPAGQGARPRPETVPGQDPRLQGQEQVSGSYTTSLLCLGRLAF